MNKSYLSTVIAVCLTTIASTAHAVDVDVTTMTFNGSYASEGQLRDDPDDFGFMQSVAPFFNEAWAAVGVAYFEAGNATPTIDSDMATDEALVTNGAVGGFITDGVTPTPDSFGTLTNHVATGDGTNFVWSGTSSQGAFSYTFTLPANQVAWGTIFNWSTSQGIPVLNVMDCTDPANCTGVAGTPMQIGPFPGQDPTFSGGLPPISCTSGFVSTSPDVAIDIGIVTEVLSLCSNAQLPVSLLSFTQPANGTVTQNAGVLTYLPNTNFNGSDTFTFTAQDIVNTAVAANFDVQVGGELQGNFTMLDTSGDVFGGTNDVVFDWDGTSTNVNEADTDFSLIGIASDKPQEFFSFIWTAHHIRIFGPGTYSFDTGCTVAEIEAMGCPAGSAANSGPALTMTVADGQYGAHILFDWSSSSNIDVVNVWDQNVQWDRHGKTGNKNKLHLGAAGVTPAEDANWALVSTDINGNDINGAPMVDGPFVNFYANFSNKPDKAGIPAAPFVNTQKDTELGSSLLASMNLPVLLTSLMMLLGLRLAGRKK